VPVNAIDLMIVKKIVTGLTVDFDESWARVGGVASQRRHCKCP